MNAATKDNWDGCERRRDDAVRAQIGDLDRRMDRFETALFATDENNEFRRPGLVVTANRLDAHLDAICKAAKFAKALVLGLLAGAASVAAIGQSMGWWGR